MTLKQAVEKIRNAWIAGLISGFITLFATLVAATSEGGTVNLQGTPISLWNLLDVFLILLFTFGIYMKSRVAAIGMFIYFLASKLLMLAAGTALPGALAGIVFLYFYFEGARGAITYHRLQEGCIPANSPTTSREAPVSSPED
jgi:hypothetical protein